MFATPKFGTLPVSVTWPPAGTIRPAIVWASPTAPVPLRISTRGRFAPTAEPRVRRTRRTRSARRRRPAARSARRRRWSRTRPAGCRSGGPALAPPRPAPRARAWPRTVARRDRRIAQPAEPPVEHVLHGHEPVELAPRLRVHEQLGRVLGGRDAVLPGGEQLARRSRRTAPRGAARPGSGAALRERGVQRRVVERRASSRPARRAGSRPSSAAEPLSPSFGRSASACGPSDGTSTWVAVGRSRTAARSTVACRSARGGRAGRRHRGATSSSVFGAARRYRAPRRAGPVRAVVVASGSPRRPRPSAPSSTATAGMSTNQNRRRSARDAALLARAGRHRLGSPSGGGSPRRRAGPIRARLCAAPVGCPGAALREPCRPQTCAISRECRGPVPG